MHKPLIMINASLCDQVSALDRGLHYGHGLFETMRVEAGQIPLLSWHLKRLAGDAPKLFLTCPDQQALNIQVEQLLALACAKWQQDRCELSATVKVLLTAGEGGRGYRTPQALSPNLIIQIMPRSFLSADYNSALLCSTRLGVSPLAGVKHLSRLEQVLAANELAAHDFFEGLVCDSVGNVIEGVSSNIFIVKNGQFFTPQLDGSGVNGVMRQFLLEQSAKMLSISVCKLTVAEVADADQLFVVNSNWGVVAIDCLSIMEDKIFFKRSLEGEKFIALGDSAFKSNSKPRGV